jgi:hypothetical protein
MTRDEELQQVAERLWEIISTAPRDGTWSWLAVAREALAIRDEAVMEAARKVRTACMVEATGHSGNTLAATGIKLRLDDAALERIVKG